MTTSGSPAATTRTPVSIRLLPSFVITVHGAHAVLPSGAQRLVAYVALGDRPQSRAALAARLWPDLEADRAAATLRSTLWQVRRRSPGALIVDPRSIQLAVDARLDHAAAIAAARALTGHAEPESLVPDAFLDDLLVDWEDDWVILERERYRQIRLHALENLCRWLVRAGKTAAAIDVGLGAVSADPLRETAQRALIEAHLADGNRSEAVREYRAFADLLRTHLGVDPTSELTALVPSRAAAGSAGRSVGAPRTAGAVRARNSLAG